MCFVGWFHNMFTINICKKYRSMGSISIDLGAAQWEWVFETEEIHFIIFKRSAIRGQGIRIMSEHNIL